MLPQIASILDKHNAAAKTEIAALMQTLIGGPPQTTAPRFVAIDVSAKILSILARHPKGISAFDVKREVLAAGVSRHTYARVMSKLKRARKISMTGHKREARYSAR